LHDPTNGKDYERTLTEEREVRGIDKNDPSYVRETYGVWSEDLNSLVFKFRAAVNVTSVIPEKLTYVFGIDLGYNDADAIAVLGYSAETNSVYLVEEVITEKQGITPLMKQIDELVQRYKPVRMVIDAGGLGKKIQEELRPRYSINLEAAQKERKFEFIELMNDDLRTGRLKAFPKSRFEEDCYLVQWDRSSADPTKLKVSNAFHSDICDAVLYAWRECKHFYAQDAQPPKRDSDAWMKAQEEKEADEMEQRRLNQDSAQFTDVQNWQDLGITDDFNYGDDEW
jgi:hypothetical protein